MNTYLNEFAKKYNYPEESVDVLLSSYDILYKLKECYEIKNITDIYLTVEEEEKYAQ